MWESHNKAGVPRHDGSGRNYPRAVYQVTEDSQSPAGSTESETLDEVMRRLLPTPTMPPPKVDIIPSDCELLIQRLLGVIRPPQPVIQERCLLTDIEIALQNLLPVSSVVEVEGPSSEPIAESLAGCFSCGDWDHETDRFQELDELFPFLPVGWQADRIRGEGLVARISNDYGPRAPTVGRDVRSPCSDLDESEDDVLSVGPMRPLFFAAPLGGAKGHHDDMIQANG